MKLATKIGKDGNQIAFAIMLTPKDKENIASMAEDATIYCTFYDDQDPAEIAEIEDWMESLKQQEHDAAARVFALLLGVNRKKRG